MIKKTTNLILYFIAILLADTDYDHPLSVQEMIDLIGQKYGEVSGVKLEKGQQLLTRQTLHKYIAEINKLYEHHLLDVHIDKKGSHYFIKRNVENYESIFLTHALIAHAGVNARFRDDLVATLQHVQSNNFIQSFEINNLFEIAKKDDPLFFKNLELIFKAIREQKIISYNYLYYNENAELEKLYHNNKQFWPLGLVCKNDHFYLLGHPYHQKQFVQDIVHLRLERLIDVKISRLSFELENSFDAYSYMRPHILGLEGEVEEFSVLFDTCVLDEILELFSSSIKIQKGFNSKGFLASLETSEKEMIYFALSHIEHVEILAPSKTRTKLKELLQIGNRRYDHTKNSALNAYLLARELLDDEEMARLDKIATSLDHVSAKSLVYLYTLHQKGLLDDGKLKSLKVNALVKKALDALIDQTGAAMQDELALKVLRAMQDHDKRQNISEVL